jgi:membrane-associated protein
VSEWLQSLGGSVSGLLDYVGSIDPGLRMLVAGVASLLEMFVLTGLIVPGDTIVLFACSVVKGPGEGALLGLAIAVGAFAGETASYALGRWARRTTRRRRIGRRVGDQRVSSAQRFLAARGGPAILAARFIPVLRTVMPFVVGLNDFPFRKFVAWSIPAALGWSAIYVTVYSVASAPLRDGSASPALAVGLMAVGALFFASSVAIQYAFECSHGSRETIA